MLHLLLTMIDDLPSMSWRLLTRGHPAFLDGFVFLLLSFLQFVQIHIHLQMIPLYHIHTMFSLLTRELDGFDVFTTVV